MKRLLSYLKPHIPAVILVLFLVLGNTALDLYKPILIGNAIDNYIENYEKPYKVAQDPSDATFAYKDMNLCYAGEGDEEGIYGIFLYGDTYYMMEQVSIGEYRDACDMLREANGEESREIDELLKNSVALYKEDLKELRKADFRGILQAAFKYILALLGVFVCNAGATLILENLGQEIIFTLRKQVFEHIHKLSVNFFNNTPVGKLVTRVSSDTEAVNEMFTNVLVKLFRNSILIVGYFVVMLRINVKLTLYAVILMPVIAALTVLFRYLSRRAYRITRNCITNLNTYLSEHISGMRLIQIFAKEKEKNTEFREKNTEFYNAEKREIMLSAVFRPVIFFLAVVAKALVLYTGAGSVLSGTISIGVLYIFVSYISSLFDPIQEMAEQFGTLQSSLASAEKVFSILDEVPEIVSPENPVEVDIKGTIEFKNVWFAYEGEEYILKDVSFVIKPGEKVAFVGETGAGKSSVLNLIGRYFDIQKGEILIDGVNIRDIDTDVLRRAIGQVAQDVFLFTGSVRSNITLDDEAIDEETMKAAARYANAAGFIEKLPNGYDEPVNERGASYSAGQRQLMAFARTLAYNPTILVLDEATANIDTETESLITEAIEHLMEGRTTIMVAHRLSTIQHADKIMVMHKGRIVESGSHAQLLAKGGRYRKLYELQFKEQR